MEVRTSDRSVGCHAKEAELKMMWGGWSRVVLYIIRFALQKDPSSRSTEGQLVETKAEVSKPFS